MVSVGIMLDIYCFLFFGELIFIPIFYFVYMWNFKKGYKNLITIIVLCVLMFLVFWCDFGRGLGEVLSELSERNSFVDRLVYGLDVFHWLRVFCFDRGASMCVI